jgi:hypothetical protein
MFFALKQPSDNPGPFNAFKQYLSRDPRFFSLKFMHDTLADVLRGKVDHPVVGDIRLVAQEMGVAGRRKIESQALNDGWEHVNAEYEVDKAGGLDLVLAYSYFAAKNFGTERIDPLALNLANQHLENPISQGLFALTGPITEIPVAASEPEVISTKTTPKETSTPIPDDLGKIIKERIAAAGDFNPDEITKELGNLKELEKLGDIGTIVSQAIESTVPATEEDKKTRFDLLEEALDDETITLRNLTRRVLRACRRIMVLSDTDRLTDEEDKGNLIVAGAERLVKMDYKRYLESIDQISEALAVTLGEEASSDVLTRISGIVPINELDESARKMLVDVYNNGMKQAAKLGDHTGMMAHLRNKWQLLGYDANDLSFVSGEFGKMMKRGRAKFALIEIKKLNSYFDENDIEAQIGMTLQAFKDLSKAPVKDRDHFNAIVSATMQLFEEILASIGKVGGSVSKEILRSQSIADVCLASISSTGSLMDSYVKRPGKSVSAVTVYPLLHEAVRPLITLALKILKVNGNQKTIKSVKSAISKFRGESSAKEAMVIEAKSHFG